MDYYKLFELQQLKLRREAMEKSYPRERELKLRKRKQELLEEKNDLVILEERLRQQASEIHALQKEKEQAEADLERLNNSMYSGNHSPKELSSMQNRIESLESLIKERGERIQNENEAASSRKLELKQRRDVLIDRMSDYEEKVEEYLAERNRLIEKLKQLDQQIEEFTGTLDETEKKFFEEENERYGTEIFSVLKKGRFCSCCNVLLESETLEKVKLYVTGIRCQNCGRIVLCTGEEKPREAFEE